MWWDVLLFVPLAVVTNTGLPLPLEPVLLYFATPHAARGAVVFAALGSLCAGAAGAVDVRLARALSPLVPPAWLAWLPRCGRRTFYAWTALLAASPLPFSLVRVALLQHRPHPLLYATAVACGRLPRFLLTVSLWQALAVPAWANAALLLAGLVLPLWGCRRRAGAVAALSALALLPGTALPAQDQGEARSQRVRRAIAEVDADRFAEALALALADELRREWPEDPGGYLAAANAYQTMMRDYRVRDHDPEFEAMIQSAETLAAARARVEPTAEAFFVLGAARGYRAVHRSRQGAWLPALREGLRSLHDMDRALALDPAFPDPLLSLGLYD